MLFEEPKEQAEKKQDEEPLPDGLEDISDMIKIGRKTLY